jgi:hydroxymethylbilane synthase
MLKRARPDVEVVDIRGNVESRIARVRNGSIDAAVLAVSGLIRLGRLVDACEILSLDVMLPAPGQGALAIEGRRGDTVVEQTAALLDDPIARACVTAERAFLARLGAGCALPMGAYALPVDGRIELRAIVFSADDSSASAASISGGCGDATTIGSQLATLLMGTEFDSGEGVR